MITSAGTSANLFEYFVYFRVGEIRAAADFPAKKVKGQVMQLTMQCSWTTQWRKVGQWCNSYFLFLYLMHLIASRSSRQGESIEFYKLNFSSLTRQLNF